MTYERQTITAESEIRDHWRPLAMCRLLEIHEMAAQVRNRNRWITTLAVALAMETAALAGLLIDKSRWGW